MCLDLQRPTPIRHTLDRSWRYLVCFRRNSHGLWHKVPILDTHKMSTELKHVLICDSIIAYPCGVRIAHLILRTMGPALVSLRCYCIAFDVVLLLAAFYWIVVVNNP